MSEELILNVEPTTPFVIAGESAGFGTVTATVDAGTGAPSVDVATSGADTAKNFAFTFHNLKYDDTALKARVSTLEGDDSTLTAKMTAAENDIDSLQEDVATCLLAVSTPLVAATVAGMTDNTKIYVYTGSETGYTAGNWYYWDGSAWVSGGTYNSTALNTDTTLLVSGAAADSATVGAKVSDLKDDIGEIAEYAVPTVPDSDWEEGNINSSTGADTASTVTIRTKHKYLFKGNILHTGVRKGAGETNNRASYIYMYDLQGNYVGRQAFTNTTAVWGIPSNAYYLRFVYGFALAEGKTVAGYGMSDLIDDWGAEFNTIQTVTLSSGGFITSGDLDNYIDTGFYLILNANVNNIAHLPSNKGGYVLTFRAAPDTIGSAQLFIQNNGIVFSRYRTSQGFNEWTNLSMAQIFGDNSLMARLINSALKKLFEEVKVKYSTLPYEDGVEGSTTYYTANEYIKGVLYSSAWREGGDVYWNKTLETYYSALANPASILYTDDITDLGIYNAHAVWGGVCSSFVSYFLNFPYYTTTADLASTLVDKEMDSIYEIEVGDILLKTGHIAIISQVYSDANGALVSVDISEQISPRFKTSNVSIDNLENYLASQGYTVKQNTFGKPRTLGNTDYATDIIFEYGNNTYVDISDVDDMWFYIPTAASVFYKKDDADSYTEVALSGVTSDTVNGVTVYNLTSIFDTVGDYLLTTDTTNAKQCFIKVIDVGTAVIADNILTLSGYQNCTPKQYYIVNLVVGEADKGFDPPDGYHATFPNKHHYIEADSALIHDIPANGKYKLCIDYETGLGLKRILSADIGV